MAVPITDSSLQRMICAALAHELPPEIEIVPATDRHGMEYIEVYPMNNRDDCHIISIVKRG